MKRFTAVLLTVFLLFLVACNNTEASLPVSSSLPSSSIVNSPSSEKGSSVSSSSKPSSSSSSSSSSSEPSSEPDSSPINSSAPESSYPVSSESVSSQVSSSTPSTPEETPSVHEEHYFYGKLTPIQKEYYNSMHTAVHGMFSSWVVLGELSDNYVKDISLVRHALVADHPEIFWLPTYYITATGKDDNGDPAALMMFSSSADVSPSFLVSRSEKAEMENELKAAVSNIASQVTATDPFEIELQLHDLLCGLVTYSTDSSDPMIYSAYGALVNGKALCEGYSRAMQLLLHHFGIPSTTVTGIAEGEGHMWNQVNIGSSWYNLDVTWNDTSSEFVSHEYFNLTDTDISKDHSFSKDFYELTESEFATGTIAFNFSKPVCEGTTNNYFTKRGFVFSKDNVSDLAKYIYNSADQMIEVRFIDSAFKDEFNLNVSAYLESINAELLLQNPDISFYIGRYSVSSLTVKFYKTPIA